MLPASFAIPYLLTAPLAPQLTMHFVAAADASCRPVAQACYAAARVSVRNQSNRTLFLDDVNVVFSQARGSSYEPGFDSPLAIPPFGEVILPDVYELNVKATQHLSFRFHETGERGRRHTGGHGMSENQAFLLAAAQAACLRCNGGDPDLCRCETSDAGRRCTSATQCQGPCLFDRFEKLSDPVCTPTARTRCPTYPPSGFRVGLCAELKAPPGCFDVLTKDDSESRPIPPPGRSRTCWNDAERITESSRRR